MKKPYPRTVAVALWFGDKLLLGRRKYTKTFPKYWELVGGKVENGESVVNAVQRETLEETGLYIPRDAFSIVDCIIGDPSTYRCFLFEVRLDKSWRKRVVNPEPDKRDSWETVKVTQALERKLLPGIKDYLKGKHLCN